ncbi:MAG: tryptophan synthase subunit alpha [Candidatus Polarisedimenticolia bacterium]
MTRAHRYQAMFQRLRERGEGAFVPFVVLGDPDPATSLSIVRCLVSAGADALELGLPFSDPVADGPAIQAACGRALASGARPADAWKILAAIRDESPDLPIGLLVYANLVVHQGYETFCARAADAGADSVLVADLPVAECLPLAQACAARGIDPVFIAPPNADDERLRRIARASHGYVYVTSRPGVTGADARLRDDAAGVIRRLSALESAPPLLGFGIASPAHVREALRMGAAGAISGSALAGKIGEHREDPPRLIETLQKLVADMKAATR